MPAIQSARVSSAAPVMVPDHRAVWIGGPPAKELQSIKAHLEDRGVSIVKQVEYPSSGAHFSIPEGVTLVLINEENTNRVFARRVRDVCSAAGVPCETVDRQWSHMDKQLSAKGFLRPTPAPVLASVSQPVSKPEPTRSAPMPLPAAQPSAPSSAAEQLLAMSPEMLAMLPPQVREGLIQAQRSYMLHTKVLPLAATINELDDDTLFALLGALHKSVRERIVVAAETL